MLRHVQAHFALELIAPAAAAVLDVGNAAEIGAEIVVVVVPQIGTGKTAASPRNVSRSHRALALVERVLSLHNSEWLWPSAKGSKSGHIESLEPVKAEGFSLAWTPHDLRRIYMSAAAAVVTNGYHLQALVNHAMPPTATGGYIEFDPDDLRPSQQAVTDRLRKRGLPL
jgi:integrase